MSCRGRFGKNRHRAAARKGKALGPRSLIAADLMILAVYRLRWQIELAFKRRPHIRYPARHPFWRLWETRPHRLGGA